MSDNQLSRRKVLGALATTGGAGAIVGTGTSALFTDEETFTDNGIRASTSVAGVVDIDIDHNVISDGTGVIYDITLPEDVNNNPSYVWFRADCPKDDELDLACATNITVEMECDGETEPVESGPVRDVFDALRNGTRLCGGDAACLELGETQTLEIRITGVDDWYDGDTETLTFDLEFYGEQCRYDTGAENPFDDYEECESCDKPAGKGISFIAFCSKAGGNIGPEITDVVARNDDGEPISVDWKASSGVDYVVVKSGQNFTIYEYDGETGGRATTGGDSDAIYYGSDPSNSASADPCGLAADKVGDGDFPDGGTSVKLEGGEIEP